MFSFFKKKSPKSAVAELVDNGREISEQAMRSPKFNTFKGAEPMFPMRVVVRDADGRSWDATMEAGPSTAFLLLPGVKVKVRFDAGSPEKVTIDDTAPSILAANPQMKRD
jgi:hypothetical protein